MKEGLITRRDFLTITGISLAGLCFSPLIFAKSKKVKSISSQKQLEKIISSHKKVVIDFSASWCGPCIKYAPIFEEVAKEYPGIIFGKIILDKIPEEEYLKLNKTHKINAVPTTVLFKNRKKISSMEGLMDKSELIKYLNSSYKSLK